MNAKDRVGTVLDGRYRIDALLGVGGMASVYSAIDPKGVRIALKVLHSELTTNAEVKARFLRESYVANSVQHPGIVRVHDHVKRDDIVFLVMDLVVGKTLEAIRIEGGGKLEAPHALRIGLDVLDILAVAHGQRIVHRDIKPDNVFLADDGRTRLMDFGIARVLDAVRMTASAALMGTPAFMSPEQAASRNREVTAASDVWSLGAVLFLLLTGEEVHPSKSGPEQIIYAATRPARKLVTAMPSAPPALSDVIDCALAFEPVQRFQSAAAMARALRHCIDTCGLTEQTRTSTGGVPARGEGPIVSGATTMIHGSGSEAPPKRGPDT